MADVNVIAPTGETGTIPEENLEAAKAAGFTIAGAPLAESAPALQEATTAKDIGAAGTYNVVAPTGEKGTVPADQLQAALGNGFKLASQHAAENEHTAKVQYYVNDLKKGIATGHVDTFLRGYADEFLAGGAEKAEQYIANKLFNLPDKNPDQVKEDEAYAEAIRKVNEEQSTTHAAGAVGGFLGQAYVGGKLAQAADPFVNPQIAKVISNPLAQAAAKEAVAGAIATTPQAMAQAVIDKDPVLAAESLAIGAGTGAILGTAIKGASRYFSKAAAEGEAANAAQTATETSRHIMVHPPGEPDISAANPIKIGGLPNAVPEDLAATGAEENPLNFTNKQARTPSIVGQGGTQFTKGKQVGLSDLGTGLEPPVQSPLNLKPGEVSINPEAFHGPDYTPASDPLFHIAEIHKPTINNEPLGTHEKLLLDHLGLTAGMRRTIGDANDQRRILTIVAKELGEGDVVAGTKQMENLTKEELALKIEKLTAENGPRIGTIRAELDKAVKADPSLRPPAITIAIEIEKLKDGLVSNEERGVVNHAVKFLTDKETGVFDSFTEADKVKHYFQKLAKFDSNSSAVTDPVKRQIAYIVRKNVDEAASKIAAATQSPKIIEDWAHYKTLYGAGKTLEAAAERTLNAPVTHEFIPGGHGALGAGYIGHVIGGAVGLPVVGPVLGVVGSKFLKHYLREGGIAKLSGFLGGRIKDEAIHSLVAVDAIKSVSERLEEIPSMVKSFAEAGAAHLLTSKSKGVVDDSIKVALGDEASGLSKQQQFERLSKKLAFMKSSPDAMQKHVGELAEGMAQHHPQLAADLSANLIKKMEYIYSILPKNPNAPMPFQHDVEWKPSPAELHDFQKQLAIANDPFHALEELKSNTLTASQVATLAVLNPDLLSKMRSEIIQMSMQKKIDLSLQKRLSMSIMMAEKMDQSLLAIPQLQAAFAPPAGPAGSPPGKKGHKNAEIKGSKMPDYRLSFQKVLDKAD